MDWLAKFVSSPEGQVLLFVLSIVGAFQGIKTVWGWTKSVVASVFSKLVSTGKKQSIDWMVASVAKDIIESRDAYLNASIFIAQIFRGLFLIVGFFSLNIALLYVQKNLAIGDDPKLASWLMSAASFVAGTLAGIQTANLLIRLNRVLKFSSFSFSSVRILGRSLLRLEAPEEFVGEGKPRELIANFLINDAARNIIDPGASAALEFASALAKSKLEVARYCYEMWVKRFGPNGAESLSGSGPDGKS